MTVKEYLNQYKLMTERLRQIEAEIYAVEAEIDSVEANSEGGHGSGKSNRTESVAIRLADIKARRETAYEQAWAKREEVENVILMTTDPIYGRLLYDRYILFMT